MSPCPERKKMRDKIEEVGIHFSRRRSFKAKNAFLNRLVGQLKEAGLPLDMIQKKERNTVSNHLVAGNLKKSRRVFVAGYDTGSRMLNPGYQYTPLDSRHNFHGEMTNVALYSLLTILMAVAAVLLTKDFMTFSLGQKCAVVLVDLVIIYLIWRCTKKPDNKVNMNRNSGAVAILYSCAEKSKTGTFLFADRTAMSNQGYFELADHLAGKEVIVLDSVAGNGDLYLAYRQGQESAAQNIAKGFDCPVQLFQLSEEQYQNTPLAEFDKGFLLTVGTMKKGTVYVSHARRSTDMDINMEQMEQIRQGILKLC